MLNNVDSIKLQLDLPISVEKAFQLFTSEFRSWWPQEYTWSQQSLKDIGIEPHQGGRCTELGPNGFQIDWGQVLVWQPPEKLVITWQISPDRVPQPNPDNASIVEVNFVPIDNTSRLYLEHKDIGNHGESAQEYKDALNSEPGWPFILKRYLDPQPMPNKAMNRTIFPLVVLRMGYALFYAQSN